MGLSGLSLQSEPGVMPLHAALNVSMRAAARLPRGSRAGSAGCHGDGGQGPAGGGSGNFRAGSNTVWVVLAVPVCAIATIALLQALRRR